MNAYVDLQTQDDPGDIIDRILDRQSNYREIRIEAIAAEAMQAIDFPRALHPRGYAIAELYFRDMARRRCRKRFDPIEIAEDTQGDLFSDTLQWRYPTQNKANGGASYVMRSVLSDADRAFNANRMRKQGGALIRHGDALEAEGRNK